MFKSEENRKDIPPDTPARTLSRTSTLGPDIFVQGEIKGREGLIIAGRIEGKVLLEGRDLTIAPGGDVKAEIRAANVTIAGSVEGRLHASGKVTIEARGRMIGDISASRISIGEGAQFKGSVKILKDTG